MESFKQQSADAGKPAFGVVRDLERLKTHGSASAAELREFLAQMRSRNPQEVLGLVAASQLARSLVLATLGAVVLAVVFSVGPYLLGSPAKPAATQTPAPAAPAEKEKKAAEKPSQQPEASAPTPASAAPASSTDPQVKSGDAEKAMKIMGIGDTKIADPKKNPMEDNLDNLLDKVE